jgi:hypothetical protein
MTMLRLHVLIQPTNQHKGRHSLVLTPSLITAAMFYCIKHASSKWESTSCATISLFIWKDRSNIENSTIRLLHNRFRHPTPFALLHIHRPNASHLPQSRAPQAYVQPSVTCSNTNALVELRWHRIVLSSSRMSDTGYRCPAAGAEMCGDSLATSITIKMHSVLSEQEASTESRDMINSLWSFLVSAKNCAF